MWRKLDKSDSLGRYIKGVTIEAEQFRTCLKFRVIEYVNAGEALLLDPYPSPPQPVVRKPSSTEPEMLFTGFEAQRRKVLEYMEREHRLSVKATVTMKLALIVGGYNAGLGKLRKAMKQGALIYSMSARTRICKPKGYDQPVREKSI